MSKRKRNAPQQWSFCPRISEKDLLSSFLSECMFRDACGIIVNYLKPRIAGKLVRTFTAPQMEHPNGTAIDGDVLYVANTGGLSLMAFDIASGDLIFNYDCRKLYASFPWHGAGPHKVCVTQNSVVLDGSGYQFHFFEKNRAGVYQRSLPFPIHHDTHRIQGEYIYSLPRLLEREYHLVYMFDLHGRLVTRLSVVAEKTHIHKEKRGFFLVDGRFYLFEKHKLLTGRFPVDPKKTPLLVVEHITDWHPEWNCYDIASEDEIYCKMFTSRNFDGQVLCTTNTGQIVQLIPDTQNGCKASSSPALSSQGLTVSDWSGGKVYLFQ